MQLVKFTIKTLPMVFIVAGGLSLVFAQNLAPISSYPAPPTLEDVLITPSSRELHPAYFLYPTKVIQATPPYRIIAQWNDISDKFLNRQHSHLVYLGKNNRLSNQSETRDTPGTALRRQETKLILFLADKWHFAAYCTYANERLRFFNAASKPVKEFLFPQDASYLTIPPKAAFDKNGKHLVFFLNLAHGMEDNDYPDLFFFLGTGTRLWQYRLPFQQVESLGIANKGQFIIISGSFVSKGDLLTPYQTLLLDSSAKIQGSFPFAFRQYDFNADDSFLALADNYSVRLINLFKKAPVFSQTVGAEARVITSCRFVAGDNIAIITGVAGFKDELKIYNDPEIIIFNSVRQKMAQTRFERDYTIKGELVVSASGEQFGLALQDRFLVFQVNN